YLGFLSQSETAICQEFLKNKDVKHAFFGGYDNAERVVLGCFPDWCYDFTYPIKAITFNYRSCDKLSHRDFLGSVMALGLKRETVGDILIEEGRAVMFATAKAAEHILSQISKVASSGVVLTEGFSLPLPGCGKLEEFTASSASARIDCIVSAITGVSRTGAAELIESGYVSVNSVGVQKTTKHISNGDNISVRGKGKFIIADLSHLTKNGRIALKYKKYI
ncbi:MAG: hypothetical protein II802_03355, partial [Clostridia bacterium]|nr:hypothetical protein [Clostridia bacterium]